MLTQRWIASTIGIHRLNTNGIETVLPDQASYFIAQMMKCMMFHHEDNFFPGEIVIFQRTLFKLQLDFGY